jgi:hypothetical protein
MVAEIVVNPAETPLATPAELMVAALGFDDAQEIAPPFARTLPAAS